MALVPQIVSSVRIPVIAAGGIAEGRESRDDAFTVAYLKRALDHLHKSQAGLEAVAPKALLPELMSEVLLPEPGRQTCSVQ